MPFPTLAVPFDPYRDLPRADSRWLLLCLARYADRDGRCWPQMRRLAEDARMSLSTVCRRLVEMARLGCFTRERQPGRRYVYTLAEPYRLGWRGRDPASETAPEQAVSASEQAVSASRNSSVSHAATQKAEPSKHLQKAGSWSHSPPDSEVFRWRARLRQWREAGVWVASYGPRPTEPGCLAPAELLSRT